MLRDWHVPPAVRPAAVDDATAGRPAREGGAATVPRGESPRWQVARWEPGDLELLARELAGAADALAGVPAERLVSAWRGTVETFRDPRSAVRRALEPALVRTTGLSREGLAAGLEAVLGGVAGEDGAELLRRTAPAAEPAPVLVVLASNLPALAVQPLLPILARRRPAVLKSPSTEPLFAAAFAAELARREPVLGRTVAALTWPGGDRELEAPLLAAVGPILAYGDAPALADLERRADTLGERGRVVAYGPKTSLAVVGAGRRPDDAAGLAQDVALFDQRGCLSVAALYVVGGKAGELARAWAGELAGELERLARRWPPGPVDATVAAAVRQVREEAALRGLWMADLPLAAGTVLVEPRPGFRPTPGLRTVRVHPVPDAEALDAALAPWGGRLQGAALAGLDVAAEHRAATVLRALGVSRLAAPGRLQAPDTRWHNGGVDPLAVLA